MVVQGSDRQHPGDSPVEFTQVDPVLALEWPAEPVVSCPEDYWSARWYGYLLPKATGTHVLRIESDFASRVTLGSTVIIDAMDSVTAVRERAQVTLTEGEPIYIEVEYQHQAGTGYLRMYWASTSFAEEIIAKEYWLHPLNTLDSDTLVTVVPQEASHMSVISGSTIYEAVATLENSFVLPTPATHSILTVLKAGETS